MLSILFASMVVAMVISASMPLQAIVYAVIASQAVSLEQWFILTLASFVMYLYAAVTRAVQG